MATTKIKPNKTARRVALWRALHAESDTRPLVFDAPLAEQIANPPEKWRDRGDMGRATTRSRASTVARSRFTDDTVENQANEGITQYVILGAGLDTFAQRRVDLTTRIRVFEIDQPGPQQWKQNRLEQLGLGKTIPTFVPVDFENGESWWKCLVQCGFDPHQPAVFASMGVSMYLTPNTNEEIFQRIARSSPGSTFVVSFLVPAELVEQTERRSYSAVARGTQRYGTPWVSFYAPNELIELATQYGFHSVSHISPQELADRYFADRSDSLTPSSAEHILVMTTGTSRPSSTRISLVA